MTNKELNKYLQHYLENDKTHSAIMLTAPWGTGKSYYIQNELKPFLEKAENGKHKCVVVSLYGLKTIADISKELYIESKTPAIFKKKRYKKLSVFSKSIATGIVGIGKTVLKALTQIDLDFSVDKPNWQKLYASVDFSGILIVLEDLERSEIDILEVMGFVNSLVEQDGVKVLLVANENEILNYIDSPPDKEGKTHKIPDANTELYLKIKEKTVSDTIGYYGDIKAALEGILKSFDNKIINDILSPKDDKGNIQIINDIQSIMDTIHCCNLRSVIFGCQKTVNLYQDVDETFNAGFLAYLLCSNIAFALRLKMDGSIKWNVNDIMYSQELGTSVFPLLREAYYYIVTQQIPNNGLKLANDVYCSQKEFERSEAKIKGQLDIIYNFYNVFETDVVAALKFVTDNLESKIDIPINEFGKLANYLVAVHQAIGHDDEIARCRAAMVRRLKTTDAKKAEDIPFYSGIEFDSKEAIQEFSEWKKEMDAALKFQKEQSRTFDYRPESIEKLYDEVYDYKNDYLNEHRFAAMFDVEKLIDLLKTATPEQISNLRFVFLHVYDFSNINDYFSEDKETLVNLKNAIDKLMESEEIKDKIVLLQLRYFSENLRSIIERL